MYSEYEHAGASAGGEGEQKLLDALNASGYADLRDFNRNLLHLRNLIELRERGIETTDGEKGR